MVGVSNLQSAIDANPRLKNAKDTTAKSLAYVGSLTNSWFGWGKKPAEPE